MINIIKSIIHFKSFTPMIKRKKNESIIIFRGIMRPNQHTLVTIKGDVGQREAERWIRRNKVLVIRGLRSSST